MVAHGCLPEFLAKILRDDINLMSSPFSASMLSLLIKKLKDQTLSSKTAKILFDSLWDEPGDPIRRIKSLGLEQIDDSSALETVINKVIKQNSDQVEQLKTGKTKILGFLVGQVMKETSGKANPQKVNDLIHAILRL